MKIQRLRWLGLVLLDPSAMYDFKGGHEGLRKVIISMMKLTMKRRS